MDYRTDMRNDWSKTLTFVGIVFVLEFIGAMALTVGNGFEDPKFTTKFIVYVIFALLGLGFILFAQAKNKDSKKRIFLIPLHEPEEALAVGKLKVFRNPILLTILSIIVFLPIFFIAGRYANTFFAAIPFSSQQVSTFSNIFGDSAFPALSENTLMFIPIILLLSANFLLFYRIKVLFWFNNILTIPLIMAFVWKAFHNLVYGSNEMASYSTFVFGYVGVLLTLVTMSAILWAVIHFMNNFILSAKDLGILANESFLITIIVLWILLWILFFGLNYLITKRRSVGG